MCPSKIGIRQEKSVTLKTANLFICANRHKFEHVTLFPSHQRMKFGINAVTV